MCCRSRPALSCLASAILRLRRSGADDDLLQRLERIVELFKYLFFPVHSCCHVAMERWARRRPFHDPAAQEGWLLAAILRRLR